MSDGILKLTNVAKRYGSRVVVDQVSLEVRRGELLCLLGPSGSGKTTLLRLIAGLEVADEGRIEINGTAQQRLEITSLYVTHGPNEAFYLGERIAIVQAGRLVQIGTKQEIIERPASEFVTRLTHLWKDEG